MADKKFCGVTLDVDLWHQVKVAAVKAGKTIPQFVSEALRAALPSKKGSKVA